MPTATVEYLDDRKLNIEGYPTHPLEKLGNFSGSNFAIPGLCTYAELTTTEHPNGILIVAFDTIIPTENIEIGEISNINVSMDLRSILMFFPHDPDFPWWFNIGIRNLCNLHFKSSNPSEKSI